MICEAEFGGASLLPLVGEGVMRSMTDEGRRDWVETSPEPSSDPCFARATFSHKWEKGAPLLFLLLNLAALLASSPPPPSPNPLPCRSSRASRFSAISCARSAGAASMSPPSSVPTATPMSMSRRPPTGASSRERGWFSSMGWGSRAGSTGSSPPRKPRRESSRSARASPRARTRKGSTRTPGRMSPTRAVTSRTSATRLSPPTPSAPRLPSQCGRLSRQARRARPRDHGGAGDHPAGASKNRFDPRRLRLF